MDHELLHVLKKIATAQSEGREYFYSREECDDPHGEVAALQELERQGYISCGKFLRNNSASGGYFTVGGPCKLRYTGQKILRDLEAQPHIQRLQDVGTLLQNTSMQTIAHLSQAAMQLSKMDNERARKDAVRDCLSAIESFMKFITSKSDIKEATAILKDSCAGPLAILKDGLSIWSKIQEIYPDVRHGQAAASKMSKAEAIYWVERSIAFIKYVSMDIPPSTPSINRAE